MGGTLASVAIICVCVWGVVLVARLRHRELTHAGLPYWTPLRAAVLAGSVVGLIGLVALQWLLAASAPPLVQ